MVACRQDDEFAFEICRSFNDVDTELCTKIERDFLSGLQGGCSTPISALAQIIEFEVIFKGNIVSPDGKQKATISRNKLIAEATELGKLAANEILSEGGQSIVDSIRKKGLITDAEV